MTNPSHKYQSSEGKEFVLATSQAAVSFEQLPTIKTPRDITILSSSVECIEVQVKGRRHILPTKTSLQRNKFLEETEHLYDLLGQALLMMSKEEHAVIIYYTETAGRLPNLPFNPNRVFIIDDKEFLCALSHLSNCTIKCSNLVFNTYNKKAKSLGIELVVV